MRVSLGAVVLVCVFFAGQGVATAKRCGDLPSALKDKCKEKVKKECAGVTGYWPKRNCEEKVAGGLDPCSDPKALEACNALQKDYEQVCRPLGERISGDDLKDLVAPIKALPAMAKRLKAYAPTARACKKLCNFGDFQFGKCSGLAKQVKANWGAYVKRYKADYLDIEWDRIGTYEKSQSWGDAAAAAEKIISRLKNKIAFNTDSGLGGDVSALEGHIKTLEQRIVGLKEKAKAAMAKIKCPAKKKPRGHWPKLMAEHFKKHNPNVTETIKRFNLHGKKKKTYHGIARNIVREHQEGVACVHRVDEKKEADCFYIYAKFSRQKNVKERKWGAWIIERFHNTTFMLCKNLR